MKVAVQARKVELVTARSATRQLAVWYTARCHVARRFSGGERRAGGWGSHATQRDREWPPRNEARDQWRDVSEIILPCPVCRVSPILPPSSRMRHVAAVGTSGSSQCGVAGSETLACRSRALVCSVRLKPRVTYRPVSSTSSWPKSGKGRRGGGAAGRLAGRQGGGGHAHRYTTNACMNVFPNACAALVGVELPDEVEEVAVFIEEACFWGM